MVDIHCHLLHGMDDGAKSFEESMAMAFAAANHGTHDLVVSPHANQEFRFDPDLVLRRIADLQTVLGDRLRLHRGCDFHLDPENIEAACKDPNRYSINGRGYLLVEFPDMAALHGAPGIFLRLRGAGLKPIITHPERQAWIADHIDKLAEWVDTLGVYVQVTAQSLTGRFGTKAAKASHEMMRQGLVHFVASDGHDLVHRPPKLDEAKQWLIQHYGESIAQLLLVENPWCVVTGHSIAMERIPVPKRKPGLAGWLKKITAGAGGK